MDRAAARLAEAIRVDAMGHRHRRHAWLHPRRHGAGLEVVAVQAPAPTTVGKPSGCFQALISRLGRSAQGRGAPADSTISNADSSHQDWCCRELAVVVDSPGQRPGTHERPLRSNRLNVVGFAYLALDVIQGLWRTPHPCINIMDVDPLCTPLSGPC